MDKIPANNTLRVTQDEADLAGSWLRAREANWLQPVDLPLRCFAKIRYRQQDQACAVSLAADGSLLVRFDHPQRAITTGQYIAFYQGDELLGGANIQTASPIF